MPNKSSLIYLASPYTHPSPSVRQQRYESAIQAVAHLIRHGHNVISPIVHSHPVAQACDLPGDFEFWQKQCIALLSKCDRVVVLTLPGWEHSRGIDAELTYAIANNIPVAYLASSDIKESTHHAV